jgi:hypothetical protein
VEIRAEAHVSVRYCCTILTEIWVCRQIGLILSNIKFYENPRGGSYIRIDRRTGRYDEANGLFLQLFVTNAPKIRYLTKISEPFTILSLNIQDLRTSKRSPCVILVCRRLRLWLRWGDKECIPPFCHNL